MVSAQYDFSPPLNFNTTTATGRGLVTSCASPSGRYSRLKSGVVFASKPLVATGCSPAPLTMRGSDTTMLWSDGSESRADFAASTDPRSGTLGINAVVTSGTLRGARLAAAPAIVAQTGFCLLGGVRSLTFGLGVFTVTDAAPAREGASKGDSAKRAAAVKRAGGVVRAQVRTRARAGAPGRALIANDLGRRVREQANLRQIDLSCFASFQFDFAPKLDNNTVTAQTTAALTGCVSPTGRHGDLLSSVLFADRGHSTATGCSPLPILVEGVGSILWNDESTSDFTFRVNTNPLADGFGLEAEISGGTLAGSRISAVPLLILQDGVCGLGGVNSLSVNFGFDVFTHRPPLAS